MTPALELRSLGTLALFLDQRPLLAGRRKLLTLLVYLAMRDGRPVDRLELASIFWPEADELRSRQSLRQALLELREVIGPGLLVNDRDVALTPGTLQLDLFRFERIADSGTLSEAEALWTGDFLAGVELGSGEQLRTWLEPIRERLRRRRARIGGALVQDEINRGAWEAALRHAESWAVALPEDETASERVGALRELAGRRRHPAPGSGALLTPDLVEREEEFARLTEGYGQAAAGLPGLLILEGDDGLGKSRLLDEFLRWARIGTPPPLILSVRAYEAEQTRPLTLARHLLAPLAGAAGAGAAPPSALAALATVAPEFLERFPSGAAIHPDHLPEALARVLAEVAAESVVVIAVDDAHLSDASSRDLLEGLLRRPVGGVLIVLTAPPGAFQLSSLERRSPEQGRLQRLELSAIGRPGIERMLASVAEFRTADRAALATRILQETGGNPLALMEMLAELADRGMIAPAMDGSWVADLPPDADPLPLPVSLRETMAIRLQRLSPHALQVLQTAAVLGRDATMDRLREATRTSADRFDAALDELVTRHLLRAPASSGGAVEFTHEMIRRTVYEALRPARRAELHAWARSALSRRPVRDSAAAAALKYHEDRSAWAASRSWPRAVAALLLLAGLIAGGLIWRSRATPDGVVQVLIQPIVVQGDSLSPAMGLAASEALAIALEHGRGLVLADSGAAHGTAPVLTLQGTLTRTSSGLRLEGVLGPSGQSSPTRVTLEAGADELPDLAAGLAARLFPGRFAEHPFALSAARSGSPEALRRYLSALRLASQRQLEAAAQQYWLASRADPSFAAAWHGLSRVNAWFLLTDRSRRMADSAVAHAAGLQERDRLLLTGWQRFAHGDADGAEALFRQVLGFSRDNLEADVGLGEVLYHHNWSRGRGFSESRPFWETAARSDPEDWRPDAHTWELAAREGRSGEAARLLRRAQATANDSSPANRVLLAQLEDDTLHLADRIARLNGDDEWGLIQLADAEGVVLARLDLARHCLLRLTEPGHRQVVQAFGHEELAYLSVSEGRWREAMSEIDTARELEPGSAAATEAALRIAPFVPPSLAGRDIAGLQRALRLVPTQPLARTLLFWIDLDRSRESLIRPYVNQLLELERGGTTPLSLPDAGGGLMADSLAELRPFLLQSLSAWQAVGAGDSNLGLARLQGDWNGIEALESEMSVFYARPWDHFLKAELLEGSGQFEAAANWFTAAGQLSIATLPYRAPARLHHGRLMERLGRRTDAIADYRMVVEWWARADPEFQPWVTEARRRLAVLAPGAGAN